MNEMRKILICSVLSVAIAVLLLLSTESMWLARRSDVLPDGDLHRLSREVQRLSEQLAELLNDHKFLKTNTHIAADRGMSLTAVGGDGDAPCTFAQHQQQRNDAAQIKKQLSALTEIVQRLSHGQDCSACQTCHTPTQQPSLNVIVPACDSDDAQTSIRDDLKLNVTVAQSSTVDERLRGADVDPAFQIRWLRDRHSLLKSMRPMNESVARRVMTVAPTAHVERRLRVLLLMPREKGDQMMDRWFEQLATAFDRK